MTTIIGIDPGMTGAIALLHKNGVFDVFDMKDVMLGGQVNVEKAQDAIDSWGGDRFIVIEEPGTRPGQSPAAALTMGINYGLLLAACRHWPTQRIRPQEWSKWIGRPAKLTPKDRKDWSRRKAMELFPDQADAFKFAKDDGRAEAVLMAWAWRECRYTDGRAA